MTNKERLNKSITSDFNKENNYNEIIKKVNKEDMKIKNNVWKWLLAPMCLAVIIVGILFINYNSDRNSNAISDYYTYEANNIKLNINNLDTLGYSLLDVDIKEIPTNGLFISWPEILKDGITIPKDLDKYNATAVYTKNDKTSQYDILNCYVYNYYTENEENFRSIRIAFSNTNKPIRDYCFPKVNSKKTIISGINITIFKCDTVYFVEFNYKDYNFDIETNNINQQDLLNLLVSIIK